MALNHMQSLDRVDIYYAALELLVDVEDLLGCGEIISNDAEQFWLACDVDDCIEAGFRNVEVIQ